MEFISEGIFEKYSKMKILVFEIFEKGQILRPFSGLAPSKLKFFQKNLMAAYVHISILPTNFQKNRRGYRKKRGPERVKEKLCFSTLKKIFILYYRCNNE